MEESRRDRFSMVHHLSRLNRVFASALFENVDVYRVVFSNCNRKLFLVKILFSIF